MIFGNLMLLADVIVMLPFWICNLYFVLANVIASLFMADGNVVAMWLMFVLADVSAICFCGCWYYHFDHQLCQKVNHCFYYLADVIARMADGYAIYMIGRCYCLVADGMPTMCVDGRCYSQGARWISHWVNVLILNLKFCVRPRPICEADGTCLCFCLGMGHWPLWIEPLLLLWWGSSPPFQLW